MTAGKALIPFLAILAVLAVLAAVAALVPMRHPSRAAAAETDLQPQTTCPVLGAAINRDLYVDHDGQRLFVCCRGCLAKVEADPAKYVAVLAERGEAPLSLATADTPAKGDTHAIPAPKEPAPLEPEALAVLLRADVPLVLIDARGPKVKTHLPGAKLLNFDAPADDVAKHVPAKDTLVVTYCTNLKCTASPMLAKALRGYGYTNVLEVPKGIDGWAEAGFPVVERGARKAATTTAPAKVCGCPAGCTCPVAAAGPEADCGCPRS